MKKPILLLASQTAGLRWAAQSGQPLTLSPSQCLEMAQELSDTQARISAVLKAASDVQKLERTPWSRSSATSEARAAAYRRLDQALAEFGPDH
jgi:alkanesulfonate monooxygenase SsuD/methylene tetrahydromethanopterin reductase-like flavin-dependent oxidoreductase (luciferase family)